MKWVSSRSPGWSSVSSWPRLLAGIRGAAQTLARVRRRQRAKIERGGEVRRPTAEAEDQRRWRGHAYARKNTGGEQGGGVRARVRRRALLGFEMIEKPPTDMTGRTHAPV
jgi:hypothetical protein